MKELIYQNKKYQIEKVDSYIPVVITLKSEDNTEKIVHAKINYMTSDLLVDTESADLEKILKESVFPFIQERDSIDPDVYAEETVVPNLKDTVTHAAQRNHYV